MQVALLIQLLIELKNLWVLIRIKHICMRENFFIKNVTKNGTSLEVEWNDGIKSQFNYMWLRDNCPTAHDPDSRHRMFNILNVSENISAKKLNVNIMQGVVNKLEAMNLIIKKHKIDKKKVIDSISPSKDVDGFHPMNVGNLSSGYESSVPCTPLGCYLLIKKIEPNLSGKKL